MSARRVHKYAALGLVLSFLSSMAYGQPQAESPESEVRAVVDGFHSALRSLDREGALASLAPDIQIYEGGEAQISRDEYAAEHLGSDMAFVAATHTEVLDRRVTVVGDAAWVLSLSKTNGKFRGREVASRGAETMVLRKSVDGWKIVHVHWSSEPLH